MTASVAREGEGCRDCSNRLLDGGDNITLNIKYKDILTDSLRGFVGL